MRAPPLWIVSALLAANGAAAHQPLLGDEMMMIHERQMCSGGPVASNPQQWWRTQRPPNGATPYSADSTFQYYRTAVQYGADNTGVKDASKAFNDAIIAWNRTANTVTTLPAYIYVPPGKYRIKKPIEMLVNTFLIGDALDLPTLIADPALEASFVISGYDAYQGEGSANKNFFMAVRNLRIDMTEIGSIVNATAIDWSVSQGCSLTNIHIKMAPSSNHTGISMQNGGSGNVISDCSFTGGAIGIHLANQQYLLKGLSFDGCAVGIYMKISYVTTIQGCSFTNCQYGVDMGRNESAGSVSIVDSSVHKCNAGVNAFVSGNGQGSLVLDNFAVLEAVAVKSSTGATLLEGSVPGGQVWLMGNINPNNYQSGQISPITRPAGLLRDGKYFTMPLPQYEKYGVDQVADVKGDTNFKVYGDNSHDDGPAINAVLKKNAGCKIVFFPQGIYQTKETIYVPPGSRIVGDVLSVISGAGSVFGDAANPQPIVKVGNVGEKGVAQFTDMLFTVGDILPGAIVIQVNMAGDTLGDVGFWNCVVRVGGSVDSLVSSKCSDSDPASCKAAFALLHVTKTASAYFEDVWGWVADHGLDNPEVTQNIAVGRGALIESTSPTWFIGSSFEHCVLYQYSLNRASNVYIAQQQTESPYWQGQGTPQRAPAPWVANSTYGDPTFDNCAAQGAAGNDQCYRAWAFYMADSNSIIIHGSAMWVFFNRMNDNMWQDAQCTATGNTCQLNMAYISGASSTFWFSLSTKSTTNLVYDTTGGSVDVVAQNRNQGSWGGVLAAYLRNSGTVGGGKKADNSAPRRMEGATSILVAGLLAVFFSLHVTY
ncbi:pectate lyase superfamily protein-domain-containing protein [Podospora didyma]|uniref:Pectate lyase superfamily protein-domain-containing protein n=1 Tax=Podospora didyma TaxID=330526 RepID=A0AAE0KK41_9PEZI|nr:pectate lyase superfamily protein-domain-containing protein [Podospora didyma]